MSGPIDIKRFGVIIAGAQKNVGPAGVTLVIIRKDLIGKASPQCPILLNYETLAKKESMYNTPPCYPIYVCGLVFQWMKKEGGLKAINSRNLVKAHTLYTSIEESSGFYHCPVDKNC